MKADWRMRMGALALTAVLVTAVCILALPALLDRALASAGLEARATQVLDRPVRIASQRVEIFPWLRLHLAGVEVASDLEIERLELGLSPIALLRGRVEPSDLELEGLRLTASRRADGRFALGDRDPESATPSAPVSLEKLLSVLPEIEVEGAVLDWVDRAVTGPPARIQLRLDRLSLAESLLGTMLELTAGGGIGQEQGRLRLSAELPLLALGEPSLHATLEAEELDPALLLPYLPEDESFEFEAGRVGVRVVVEGSRVEALSARTSVELTEGRLGFESLALECPCLASGIIERGAQGPAVHEGRASFASVQLAELRSGQLDISFDWVDGRLAIAAIDLETVEGRMARSLGPEEAPLQLDLDVREAGRLELRGPADGAGLLFGLAELEARDVDLVLEAGPARTRLLLDSVRLSDLVEGARPTLDVAARLGEQGAQGRLRLRVTAQPFSGKPDPRTLEVTGSLGLEELDPEPLLTLFPAQWKIETSDVRLDSTAELEGSLEGGLHGPVRLAFPAGRLTLSAVELAGPVSIAGELATRPDAGGPRLSDAKLLADRITIGEHQARQLEAGLEASAGRLALPTVELVSYAGRVDFDERQADVAALGVELQILGAEQLSASGPLGPWPFGGLDWLRVPSQASLRAGTVRFTDHTSVAPAVDLRSADADLEGFARGSTAQLRLKAAVGEAEAESGQVDLRIGLGRLGQSAGLRLLAEGRVVGFDPAIAMRYLPADFQVAGAPGPVEADVKLRLRAGGPGRLELDARIASGDVKVRDVRLEAPLRWQGQLVRESGEIGITRGRLDAGSVEFSEQRARGLSAVHTLEGRTLTLTELAFRAYQGQFRVEGDVELVEPLGFDVRAGVQGFQVGLLTDDPSAFGTEQDPMRMDVEGSFRGNLTDEERWLAAIEGSGDLRIEGGLIPGTEILASIGRAMAARVPGLQGLQEGQVRRTRLQSCTAPFRIVRGRVRSEEFELVTDDYRLTGQLRLSQNLDMRLRGEVGLTATGVSQLLALRNLPTGLRHGLRLPAFPIEIRGPLSGPTFTTDVRSMPLATVRGLVGLPLRARDVVQGAAGAVRGLGSRNGADDPVDEPAAAETPDAAAGSRPQEEPAVEPAEPR